MDCIINHWLKHYNIFIDKDIKITQPAINILLMNGCISILFIIINKDSSTSRTFYETHKYCKTKKNDKNKMKPNTRWQNLWAINCT